MFFVHLDLLSILPPLDGADEFDISTVIAKKCLHRETKTYSTAITETTNLLFTSSVYPDESIIAGSFSCLQ